MIEAMAGPVRLRVSPERIQRGIRINERKALIRACYKATLNPGRKAGHTERRDKMMEPAGGPVIAPDKRPFDVDPVKGLLGRYPDRFLAQCGLARYTHSRGREHDVDVAHQGAIGREHV